MISTKMRYTYLETVVHRHYGFIELLLPRMRSLFEHTRFRLTTYHVGDYAGQKQTLLMFVGALLQAVSISIQSNSNLSIPCSAVGAETCLMISTKLSHEGGVNAPNENAIRDCQE